MLLAMPLSAQPLEAQTIAQNQTSEGSRNQTITIKGIGYDTGVKLGLPIPALIRAKALAQKKRASIKKPKNT